MTTSQPRKIRRNADLIPGKQYLRDDQVVTFLELITYESVPGRYARKPLVRFADGRQGVTSAKNLSELAE